MLRHRLCEVLSSLANCEITERDFEISEPSVEDGVHTSVMVRPRNGTRRYGFQKIKYLRFDLSTIEPVVIQWNGEQSTLELAENPAIPVLMNYRIPIRGKPGISIPRALTIRKQDVVDMPVSATTNLTRVMMRAHETSDLFIGGFEIQLIRT